MGQLMHSQAALTSTLKVDLWWCCRFAAWTIYMIAGSTSLTGFYTGHLCTDMCITSTTSKMMMRSGHTHTWQSCMPLLACFVYDEVRGCWSAWDLHI